MEGLFILMLTALSFQPSQVETNDSSDQIWILPGPPWSAALGTNVTFSCGMDSSDIKTITWFLGKEIQTICNSSSIQHNLTECSLRINPVEVSSEGCYTCRIKGRSIGKRTLTFNVTGANATVHLSTGDLIDMEAGPLCIKSSTKQAFECRVQDAKPGVWNFTWILEEVNDTSMTTTQGSIGNMSSRYTVHNPGEEGGEANLTCRAASQFGESLNVTIGLQFCPVSEYEKFWLRFFTSVCVIATFAAIIGHILICKYMS